MTGGSAHPTIAPNSFGFRYSCYTEFHWDYEQVKKLPESEARKLAIVFEEVAAHQYRENKKAEKNRGARDTGESGFRPGFEEDFSFGEDDPSDYSDRPDVKEAWPFD